MHDYVVQECRRCLERELPSIDPAAASVAHSMGRARALVVRPCGIRRERALSRHSPNSCSHPSRCTLGEKGLQSVTSAPIAPAGVWSWDACELIVQWSHTSAPQRLPLLIDQGLDIASWMVTAPQESGKRRPQAPATHWTLRRQPGLQPQPTSSSLSFIDDQPARERALWPCLASPG